MKKRLSHRWRIAISAAGMAAVLFAAVFLGVYLVMSRMAYSAAADLLDAPMSEVLTSLKSGDPLDEEVGAQDRVTVIVFRPDGSEQFRSGPSKISPDQGSGEASMAGHDFIFRSQAYAGKRVIAAADWTESRQQLHQTASLFLALLLPLAASVGLAAFVSAGLMYRPLRQLTIEAHRLATTGRADQLADPEDQDFSPLAQELNVLLARISREIERQELLVSDVAHDIRTPLTVIRGRLETALLKGKTSEYQSAMEIAIKETVRLSSMADSILRGQETKANAQPTELSSIVAEVVTRWQPIFEQRGAHLAYQAVECWSKIPPEEWTSILDNLLDNAFKYGGDSCVVDLAARSSISLRISDNGAGVPESERHRIYDRFVRLDSSRSATGHGLGLFLCAEIVRSRGGSIAVEAAGSPMTILVELPLLVAPP